MVDKTTSFKKRAKGRKGTSRRMGSKLLLPWRSPKLDLSLKLSASTAKEMVTGSRTAPNILAGKKDGKVHKGIFDIHVIHVYLTNARSRAWVFDTGSLAHICNSKQGLGVERRLAKDEVMMRVGNGSKADVIAISTLPLHLPLGLVLDLNNCYLVPALSMNIIWILFDARRLFI